MIAVVAKISYRPLLLPGLVLLLGPSLTACDRSNPATLQQGDELYDYYCASCHEERGLGRQLEHLPPQQRSMQAHEIVLMVTRGYTGQHPEFTLAELSDSQADALARYTYSLPASADN